MPLVAIIAVYAGGAKAGEQALEPLRKFGPPLADLIRPMPYTDAQRLVDEAVSIGHRYYWKSNFAPELSDGLAEVLENGAAAMPSPGSMILAFEIKGEIRRVPKEAMAFDHRDANFELSVIAHWTEPGDDVANIRWAPEVWAAAQPFVSRAAYANHLTADESEERIRAAYGLGKYARLAALKARYDPTNFFRLNHNIAPREGSIRTPAPGE